MVELTKQNCKLCNEEKVCYKLIDNKSVKFFCEDCLNKPENSHLKEEFRDQIYPRWKKV